MITASELYDHVSCPRRVDIDAHGDGAKRDELSPFVRMLWARSAAHEAETLRGLTLDTEMISDLPSEERERATIAAMNAGRAVIQNGRIAADDLLGDPDLLLWCGHGYIAAEIKAARGGGMRYPHPKE